MINIITLFKFQIKQIKKEVKKLQMHQIIGLIIIFIVALFAYFYFFSLYQHDIEGIESRSKFCYSKDYDHVKVLEKGFYKCFIISDGQIKEYYFDRAELNGWRADRNE